MIGTFRWNLAAATIGFCGTLLLSLSNNILTTALVRSLYSGLFLFILAYLFRWLLGTLVRTGIGEDDAPDKTEPNDTGKGHNIDLATPEDDGLPDVQGFEPLRPPKLSTKTDISPEELTEAVRRMKQE